MTTVQNEFGYSQFVHWENHVSGSDPFSIPETVARGSWYGVSGIPHVRIDGKYSTVGAGACNTAAAAYRGWINQRLNETGHNSPVEIIGSYLPSQDEVAVQATFRLAEPATLVNSRATLLVYENDVYWCCGYGGVDTWEVVTRGIYDQNVVLSQVGDEVTISTSFVHNGEWNPDNMFAAAYLQQTSGDKQIIQGALLPKVLDFTFDLEHKVRSVPDGNGAAVFNATLTNIGDAADTFTLEPGAPLGDWTTDFAVCGDPSWHTTAVPVVLGPGEQCQVQIRVHTNAAVEERTGGFRASSAASLREQNTPLRVFNGSYSVLLVDDDDYTGAEVKFVNALNTLGYLFENWNVYTAHSGKTPTYGNMSGFDYVIWQTGQRFSNIISADDEAELMEYMNRGGSFFFASQGFIDTQTLPNAFVTDYLGVSSWVIDRRYTQVNGVAGDPIGDGMSLPLDYDIPSLNDSDHLVPGPNAIVCCVGSDGSNAILRNTLTLRTTAKCVYMATAFDAMSDTDADPNNTRVLLQRVLDWLRPEIPASADDLPGALSASRIDGARPNPFNPRTEIAFTLSSADAGHPVRLEVFDLAGRKVAGLVDGTLEAGSHFQTWDGMSDAGTAARSGMYFARLTTQQGAKSEKLMLLK